MQTLVSKLLILRSLPTRLKRKKVKLLMMLLKEMVLSQVELWTRLIWTKAMLRRSSLLLERRF